MPIFRPTDGGIFRPGRTGVVGGPYVAISHNRRQLRPVCRGGDSRPSFRRTNGGIYRPVGSSRYVVNAQKQNQADQQHSFYYAACPINIF